jgi:outer membrane receptor protein involved in Fe transport
MELYAYGEAARGLRLLGGLTWLKPEITRSATPALVGNRPIGTSRLLANLGVEWDVPAVEGLTLVGDLAYTGAQFVDQANRLRIPAGRAPTWACATPPASRAARPRCAPRCRTWPTARPGPASHPGVLCRP